MSLTGIQENLTTSEMRGVERCILLLHIKGSGTMGAAVTVSVTFVKPAVRGLFHFTTVFFSNFHFDNYSNFTLNCDRYDFKT